MAGLGRDGEGPARRRGSRPRRPHRARATGASPACRAASSSGSHSRAHWRWSPGCSCSTSRSARSTGRGASASCARSAALLDRTGLPALYVTHDHEEAFALADRVAVMRDGRVVQEGTPSEVWRQPADEWTATFLGFGPAVDGEIGPAGVVTPWGVVPAARSTGGAGRVRVVLRPDALRIDAAAPVGGRVVGRVFGGDRADLVIDAGGAPLHARGARARCPRGRRVDPLRDRPRRGPGLRREFERSGRLTAWRRFRSRSRKARACSRSATRCCAAR